MLSIFEEMIFVTADLELTVSISVKYSKDYKRDSVASINKKSYFGSFFYF